MPDSLFLVNSLICLNLYLLVSSADNLCKQFGPRSGPAKRIGQDLDPNCLTLYRYSGNIFLEKQQQQQQQTDFEKYQQTTNNLVGKKSL